MGRRTTNPVEKYFKKDKINLKSTCLVEDCNVILSSIHSGNLETHIRTKHDNIYNTLKDLKSVKNDKRPINNEASFENDTKRKKVIYPHNSNIYILLYVSFLILISVLTFC